MQNHADHGDEIMVYFLQSDMNRVEEFFFRITTPRSSDTFTIIVPNVFFLILVKTTEYGTGFNKDG